MGQAWTRDGHGLGGAGSKCVRCVSAITGRANGARTLVRRKVGWRRGLDVSHCRSARPP
jgi:hypothetical protein